MSKKRQATVSRNTQETQIQITLAVDGCGKSTISTGMPFLDHMLASLAKHGLFDLSVRAEGDLEVDIHHTNEDVGIVLGQCFAKAIGNKQGMRRFGFFSVPMDETLVRASLDFSGRPYFSVIKNKGVKFSRLDTYSFHDASEFLRAFSQHAGLNLIIEVIQGEDSHHIIEAMFKAIAKALDTATQRDSRIKGIPSTKGTL